MKIWSYTLGCKVNTYETEFILNDFQKHGYIIDENDPDVIIVNTCTVTNGSDAKSRKLINKVVRNYNGKIIVVMGCFIQANKNYSIDGISIIIGNEDKSKVYDLVQEYINKRKTIIDIHDEIGECFEDMFIDNMNTQTRAFVKIQDGCENYCSYCIIPFVRGKCRSKNKDKVIKEITTLVNNSYREIVLAGIHTGHYGVDINYSFTNLLKEIIKIKGLLRIRISSIEITELTDEFIDLLASTEKIANHLHIPLQSGSDEILKLMNRKYLTDYYFNKISRIRSIRKDISISTDLIVGFPYENDELFKDTLMFLKKVGFSKIHVFPYSKRSGTKAAIMNNQVSEDVKKKRVNEVMKLSNELEVNYMNDFINKIVEVLIENNQEGYSYGHTSNYLHVKVNGIYESNSLINVMINDIQYPYVFGLKIE